MLTQAVSPPLQQLKLILSTLELPVPTKDSTVFDMFSQIEAKVCNSKEHNNKCMYGILPHLFDQTLPSINAALESKNINKSCCPQINAAPMMWRTCIFQLYTLKFSKNEGSSDLKTAIKFAQDMLNCLFSLITLKQRN